LKKGNPNGVGSDGAWPKYAFTSSTTDDLQRAFLILEVGYPKIGFNLNAEQCAFWDYVVPVAGNFTQYVFN
jgi:hypothetical protein